MEIYQREQMAYAGTMSYSGALPMQWKRSFPDWFQTIPPERVGPTGEYDYWGLQKRVEKTFRQSFSSDTLAQLSVSQRGRVVILQGRVRDAATLRYLVELAQQVEGTIRVEAYAVECEIQAEALLAR